MLTQATVEDYLEYPLDVLDEVDDGDLEVLEVLIGENAVDLGLLGEDIFSSDMSITEAYAEALDSSLITKSDFERLRKAVLREFEDMQQRM